MIKSRKIEDLRPKTADRCRAFIEACDAAGIDVIITCTLRDHECQDALFAQGRTKPGKKVTNVAGGDSFHNWGAAFDFCPIENGKAIWDDDELWARCGFIAEQCGLEWGGSWDGFVDKPHCQDTDGHTIAEYKSGVATRLA